MVRPEKAAEVEFLNQRMKDSAGMVLADFSGLSVAQVNDLRRRCRENNVRFRVVKNRLARRAAADSDYAVLDSLLKGPTGIAFGLESAVEPAKVLVDFAEANEKITIKGAYLDGKVLDPAGVEALSKVPTKPELIAMIMRGMQAPASGFVGVLQGSVRKLAGTLEAVRVQKEEQAS